MDDNISKKREKPENLSVCSNATLDRTDRDFPLSSYVFEADHRTTKQQYKYYYYMVFSTYYT